jgi:hypothetical protein
MRQIILVLISLITISCNCIKEKESLVNEKENIVVKVKLLRSYDSTYHNNITQKTFDIRLTMLNNSKITIKYWTYCCSWEDVFLINNDYISFIGTNCTKNIPVIDSLKSNDSLTIKTILLRDDKIIKDSSRPYIETTKIGFLFCDASKYKRVFDLMPFLKDRSLQDKVYWSNPLFLSDIK